MTKCYSSMVSCNVIIMHTNTLFSANNFSCSFVKEIRWWRSLRKKEFIRKAIEFNSKLNIPSATDRTVTCEGEISYQYQLVYLSYWYFSWITVKSPTVQLANACSPTPTRRRVKSSRDVSKLVFNPVQPIRR